MTAERGAPSSPRDPLHPPVITLLTDFGLQDYYVGAMKGVLLRHAPGAVLVDLTHQIPAQDTAAGAFILDHAAREFPRGSVHVAVVDPGVGTVRRPLAARAAGRFFVAPDNGLLHFIMRDCDCEVRAIENAALRAPCVSTTFHGRDLFAPAAAHLAAGFPFRQVGPVVPDPVELSVPRAASSAGGEIEGEIIYVDHFGNLVTNVTADMLGPPGTRFLIGLAHGRELIGPSRTYGDVPRETAVALIGSADLLEIAVRDGNARSSLGLDRHDPVRLLPLQHRSNLHSPDSEDR